jgi:hypothetical protein
MVFFFIREQATTLNTGRRFHMLRSHTEEIVPLVKPNQQNEDARERIQHDT